jgi:ribosome-binding protein aMBF1 (putative translation factor)
LSGSRRRASAKTSREGQPGRRAGAATKKRAAQSVRAMPRPRLLARFGERVRAFRTAAEMSQADLAAAAGMRQPYVADIERGVINPTLTTIAALAAGLGVAMNDLV